MESRYLPGKCREVCEKKKRLVWIRPGAYQGQRFHTLEGFRETEDTKNERDVRMLLEALSRCKPCEAVIHTESQYLQGTFSRLAHYRENGWMKSDGTEIKYKELWQQVSNAAVGKEITFRMGTHEFSGWLQREIQHKEENKDV